ncbi:LysR family transcriptional regulator [Novosphingobium sp. AAP1]|uniref:LysR family transcriptional regulator n=1 Tax=Novosphingobium sp. AAP1 TaxID=1523413 RepID=UPI0006B8D88B|nr:LysR family transcriptional regulator [Novosphingobium sp. AAP1]KPF54256.1 LysR family transcriptional regulator [Novosphingobium sp. AAP1]
MDKRPSIDPRALLTFRTVCREGSISAAARVLNIAQPSVSAAIAQLEARLGVQLFERRQTGVRPTAQGALLAERAEAMHHVLIGAQEELDNLSRGLAGPLRIGGTPGALVSLLPFVIGRLEARIGPCALSVVERPDGVLIDLLRQRQIDLAFVTTEMEAPPPDIAERTFARDPFALIVGRRHDALPSAVSLREVAGLPWVLPEAQGAFRRQVDALFIAAQAPVPANVVRCDSLLTTKAIVRMSDRITVLPRQVAASELSIGVLRGIEIREAAFQRSIGVRLRHGEQPSIAAQALLDVMASKYSPEL